MLAEPTVVVGANVVEFDNAVGEDEAESSLADAKAEKVNLGSSKSNCCLLDIEGRCLHCLLDLR